MRTLFIYCKSRATARRRAPRAATICRADGGFWAFEDVADARIWRGQR